MCRFCEKEIPALWKDGLGDEELGSLAAPVMAVRCDCTWAHDAQQLVGIHTIHTTGDHDCWDGTSCCCVRSRGGQHPKRQLKRTGRNALGAALGPWPTPNTLCIGLINACTT